MRWRAAYPVRLITEPGQYRARAHVGRVERRPLYMARRPGEDRAHAGLNHQKSVILYDQNGPRPAIRQWSFSARRTGRARRPKARSNTTSSPRKPDIVHVVHRAVRAQVEQHRRRGREQRFVPLPPDAPKNPTPANGATGLATTVRSSGSAARGRISTTSTSTRTRRSPIRTVFADLAEDPAKKTETPLFSYALPVTLTQGRRTTGGSSGKTMALKTKRSAVELHHRRQAPPPPTTGTRKSCCMPRRPRSGRKLEVVRTRPLPVARESATRISAPPRSPAPAQPRRATSR